MPKTAKVNQKSAHARSPRASSALVAFWVIVGSGVFGAAPAGAHDALPTAAQPNGWSYPFSCCSGYDCRAVPQTAISERPEGYVIQGTGEVLPYRDARLKDSPDGEFHWCSVAGANDSRTICLFVPPRSY
ncbi:hypothetical protein [Kumtagia ephedrae]|jgi:hypothetical protein|uniref:hypothetical protein n=1 Tax=Kumtagia ephedrae TaxID=2116701 RepID=UPI001FE15DB4|nr:hypothetical protein [Mesorhizobium ephedrae]